MYHRILTRKLFVFALIGNLLIFTPASAQAALINNLGFETPLVTNSQYNPTGSNWVFSGLSGVATNGSAFTFANPPAPEGTQVAFLQQDGMISQSFTLLTDENLSFTFAASQRRTGGSTGPQPSEQDFKVFLDSTEIGYFLPTSSTDYLDYSVMPIAVLAGNHTLSFVGLNSIGGDNTVLIDNVHVNYSAVPTPSAFWLLIIGFASFCFLRMVNPKFCA